jgi:poly-gamma-glutamate capsule biosynthesis protein CapA/YwtB (metallophosphatase superfamily)
MTAADSSVTRSVVLGLTGDVMLGRLVAGVIAERGFAHPWGNLLPVIRDRADLLFVNLECTLTSATTKWYGDFHKPFHFRAEPAAVECLRLAHVDCVTLANNHAGDFGVVGLLDTLDVLDRACIAHAGAGADLTCARATALLETGGTRVAVIGFADHPKEWAAGPAWPGISYTPVSTEAPWFDEIAQLIAAARASADLVVCAIHWGPNMRPRPTVAFGEFARRVLDAGADVFWGHSAHVVQGIEARHGKVILYDTGDFVDDYRVDRGLRNDLSFLFLVHVALPGTSPARVSHVELVPVKISACQVNLATGPERDWIVARVSALSAELGTVVVDGPRGVVVEV